MCDGQHRVLQDYLREQPDNFKVLYGFSDIIVYVLYCTCTIIIIAHCSCHHFWFSSIIYYTLNSLSHFFIQSLNVISEICELLQTYTNDLTRNENLEEIYHILQSLIETCVGNFKNQKVIFYKQVMEPIDKILQIPLDDLLNECTRVDDENVS